MKQDLTSRAMWLLFKGSFARAAEKELAVPDGKALLKSAVSDYRKILASVDPLDPKSRFKVNILSASMLLSILMNLPQKPSVNQVTSFYREAMIGNRLMRSFASNSKNHTPKGREKLKRFAAFSQTVTNPYDWKFTVSEGPSAHEYTATFTTCGIWTLFKAWGYESYVPAMCALDYTMAELNHSVFTRQYTLASGGPYCDCHYNHRGD